MNTVYTVEARTSIKKIIKKTNQDFNTIGFLSAAVSPHCTQSLSQYILQCLNLTYYTHIHCINYFCPTFENSTMLPIEYYYACIKDEDKMFYSEYDHLSFLN